MNNLTAKIQSEDDRVTPSDRESLPPQLTSGSADQLHDKLDSHTAVVRRDIVNTEDLDSQAQEESNARSNIIERPTSVVNGESVGDRNESLPAELQDVVMQDIESNVAGIKRATEIALQRVDRANDSDRPLVSPPLTERSQRIGTSVPSSTPDLEEIKAQFEALHVPGHSEPPEVDPNASKSALVMRSIEVVVPESSELLEDDRDAPESKNLIDFAEVEREIEFEPPDGSIEAKRRQRAKDFDSSLFDSYAKPQSDDFSDIDGLRIWGHIDPRTKWSKQLESEESLGEFLEKKMKEIEARGGRKANFGKKLTSQMIQERRSNGWLPGQDKPADIDKTWTADTRVLEENLGVRDMDEMEPGVVSNHRTKEGVLVMKERPTDETGRLRKRRKVYPLR